MALNNRFILASYNPFITRNFSEDIVLSGAEQSFGESNVWFLTNENYPTGIPKRIVWNDHLGIVLHGIVFPKNSSIDDFAANPDPVLQAIIAKHMDAPEYIPYEFSNGSYVGFIIDSKKGTFYAFTSFLNSIPLYYCLQKEILYISTDLQRLAKLCGKSASGLTNGLIEYYHLGTNLSVNTAIVDVYSVPKGAYIKFDGKKLETDYYYIMPSDEANISFDDTVDAFDDLWKKNLSALNSQKFRFGLGFTGGVDSRLILAGWPEIDKLITFTGGNSKNPDYILAHHIAEKLGIAQNHFLEDYTYSEKLKGYIDVLKISDNPLLQNSSHFMDQFLFRKSMGFTYEFIGLTEFLGGVYHYTSRSSVSGLIKSSLPVMKLAKVSGKEAYMEAVRLGVRENMFEEILELIDSDKRTDYASLTYKTIELIKNQVNANDVFETFIERFRHIHKMANLLTWNKLPGRIFNELISPSLNIQLTDFAAKTPLRYRDQRRLLLAWIKRYHPDFAGFVLSGSIFNPGNPWIFHKTFNPAIKSLNALGYKIPFLQWYFNKRKDQTLQNTFEFARFQNHVCQNSEFLHSTIFGQLYEQHKDHKLRRWRLFNIALLEKRINLNDQQYEAFIMDNYEKNF